MNFGDIFKNVVKGYTDKLKMYATLIGGAVLGGIILICCLGGAIAGGDESMDGGGTSSGTVNTNGMESANPNTQSGATGEGTAANNEEQFERYLHEVAVEGNADVTTVQNEEGQECYRVINDPSGQGATVGYGVDINRYEDQLREQGYDPTEGALIPVTVVEELEEDQRNSARESVDSVITSNNIELEEYQIRALTARVYYCGENEGLYNYSADNLTFIEAYNTYWNQEEDGKYGEGADAADFTHPLYTNYMSGPNDNSNQQTQVAKTSRNTLVTSRAGETTSEGTQGAVAPIGTAVVQGALTAQRKYEWILFQTGQYVLINEKCEQLSQTNHNTYKNINLYNSDGSVNENSIQQLEDTFKSEFKLHEPGVEFPQYDRTICRAVKGPYLGWDGEDGRARSATGLIYQCPWWANGRASLHLGKLNVFGGDGRTVAVDATGYNKGTTPKANSIVSYEKVYINNTDKRFEETNSDGETYKAYGHVAYVEAVDTKNGYYYISHAGGGRKWHGITKHKIDQSNKKDWLWYSERKGSVYKIRTFLYLDEPTN